MVSRCRVVPVLALLAALAVPLSAQQAVATEPIVGPVVRPTVAKVDLRSLPKVPKKAIGGVARSVPRRTTPRGIPPYDPGPAPDPLVQGGGATTRAASAIPAPSVSFAGKSYTGARPPDTVGDVGPNHYIQMVNTVFTIYDKSGAILAGPSDISSLWASAGGLCSTRDDGDPIVLYDPLADRWLLSQLADDLGAIPAEVHECVAVSQTGDPVAGGWFLYDFPVGAAFDYPKLAVWPDAYYMGANLNESGAGLYALDRGEMLAGKAAGSIAFGLTAPGYHSMVLPADLDGSTEPPAGSPGIFYRFVDGATGGGTDRLQLWQLHADFAAPADSSLTGPQEIATAAFALLCTTGGLTWDCIAQKGTSQKLDSITEWPMWRLQYRNFGSYETLVGNHAVNVGSDQAGVRWFELRRSQGSAWSLRQEGTYAPDADSRWMASAAMDRAGDIVIGYNVSSSATYPSLRYSGRLYGDAPGTMSLGEGTLMAGGGSETGDNRWGDYSALSVDPTDDCTFWFTGEYFATSSLYSWSTRIGAFTLPACSAYIFRDDFEYDTLAAWSQVVQ